MEQREFKFRPGYNWKVDPKIAGETIEQIAAKNDAREVTPDMVVEEARHPDSPLHGCFDWNNDAAAEKWRKHTARLLIGSIMVNITVSEPEVVRAFVNIKVEDEGQAYCSIKDVMEDEEKMQIVIGQAKGKLVAASRQLKAYEKLQHMSSKIDELVLELEL